MNELDRKPPAADGDPPPPLLVSGPDGRRLTIEPSRSTHTVGELADAVGVPRRAAVLIDGRPIDRRVRLDRAGVVAGVRVAGANTRVSCRADRDLRAEVTPAPRAPASSPSMPVRRPARCSPSLPGAI